jgi:hypothetical protein
MKVQDNKLFFFRVYKGKKSRADILTDRVSEWIVKRNLGIDPHFIKLLFSFCNPNLQNIAF